MKNMFSGLFLYGYLRGYYERRKRRGEKIYVPVRAELNVEYGRERLEAEIESQIKWTNIS